MLLCAEIQILDVTVHLKKNSNTKIPWCWFTDRMLFYQSWKI